MKKLTAEVARRDISNMRLYLENGKCGLSLREELYLQALEIALPVLEQQESQCQKCGGTGMADSGGTQPWGEAIMVECDCQFEHQVDSDGWIEWGGGECPVSDSTIVEVRFRSGRQCRGAKAEEYIWTNGYGLLSETGADIIAYRVIENDGREYDPLSRRTDNT